MGIISGIEKRARIENPKVPLSSANILGALGLGYETPSGVTVNHDKALGITAFWAGVRMISQTVACLPLEVYENLGNKKYRKAEEHPAHKVLYTRPNKYMTPFTYKEIRTAHCLTWGNSYAEIERDGGDRPVALWPLLPDRTGAEFRNGEKYYYTDINGVRVWLAADKVLHVPGLGFDGIQGYNVIKVHRDSLGLTVAANEYGAQFFGNSARPSGYIKHPGNPQKDDRDQLREEWGQAHQGLTKAQRTAVLWGNMEWHPISVPPEEAQFLQSRELQIEEVARILNINPILLQHHHKATSWGSGIAQFLIAYSKFTITPWLEREEDVCNWDLFKEGERGRYYVKYNESALLRGDMETQAKVLEIKRRNGVINADEWRELDEENPLPDGQGQIYLVPLNMAPLDQISLKEETKPPGTNNRTRERRSIVMRQRLRDAHLSTFEDGARRYLKRDTEAFTKAIKRAFEQGGDPQVALKRWIEEFYPGQEQYIGRVMLPLVTALSAVVAAEAAEEVAADAVEITAFANQYTENLARREAGSSRGQILSIMAVVPDEELQEALTTRVAEWEEKRPGKVAADETVRVAAGAARFAWTAAGMSYLVWRANPGACEFCQSLDGTRIGIKEYFLVPGESVTPSEKPGGLVAGANIATPPIHQGCRCDISPE